MRLLIFAIVVRLLFFGFSGFSIYQQDNYADYAAALVEHRVADDSFSFADRRLFPGYPLLIGLVGRSVGNYSVAGWLISFLSSLVAIYIFWLMVRQKWLAYIFVFLPPVWLLLSNRVATEPLMTMLFLMVIFLWSRGRLRLAGLIASLSIWVRLIGLVVVVGLLVKSKTRNDRVVIVLCALSSAIGLLVYNRLVFGGDWIFIQLLLNSQIGRSTVGLFQLGSDIWRAYEWGQYRILFSGLAYLFFSLLSLAGLWRYRRRDDLDGIFAVVLALGLVFVFTYGPNPLLEEYSRFVVPLSPIIIYGVFILFSDREVVEPFARWWRFKKTLKYVPRQSKLLDLGCGPKARYFRYLTQNDFSGKYWGVDPLLMNTMKGGEMFLHKTDIDKRLKFPDESFDVVVMLAVLEHLQHPREILRESVRVLKKGGVIVVTTPTPSSRGLLEFLAFGLGWVSRREIAEHKNYFDREDLVKMCRGLKVRKVYHEYFEFGLNNLLIVVK